jgi:hypothetical protein
LEEKKMNKRLLVGLTAGIVASTIFTAGVLAGTSLQKITAYKDFSVVTKVDNVDKKFVSGKTPLYPVLYNNKYYVPVEEFCQANKITVNYDAKKKTYYFGRKDGRVALSEIKDRDLSYMGKIIKDKSLLVSNGEAGDFGLQVTDINSAAKTVSFMLNNKYKTLTFSAIPLDNGKKIQWAIKDDDKAVLKTFEITGDEDQTGEITVDVTGVNKLYIEATGDIGGNDTAILKDLYLTVK